MIRRWGDYIMAAYRPSIWVPYTVLWAVGLIAMFLMLEIAGNWSSDIVSVLRLISPAGIIFLLAGLIVLIGCATRFARS